MRWVGGAEKGWNRGGGKVKGRDWCEDGGWWSGSGERQELRGCWVTSYELRQA